VARVGLGCVSHLWFGFEFGKFPLKMSNFSIFFPSDQKNLFGSGQKVTGSKVGQPLIYYGSKVSSGRVLVESGPISKFYSHCRLLLPCLRLPCEPTNLDLGSQSGAFDLSAVVINQHAY